MKEASFAQRTLRTILNFFVSTIFILRGLTCSEGVWDNNVEGEEQRGGRMHAGVWKHTNHKLKTHYI